MTTSKIKFVLVNTSHPGNIGAAARAMKTMGLERLDMVDPIAFPNSQATDRSAGADDLLRNATVYDQLEPAVAECQYVIGTSARRRSIDWPVLSPCEAATEIVSQAQNGQVAVVFGQEQAGLTNEHVECCNALVQIPSVAHYQSLNLASAVQIIAYEIRLKLIDDVVFEAKYPPAKNEELQRLYDHLEQTLYDLEFIKSTSPVKLMRQLKGLFNRAHPIQEEVQIWRGILTAIQAKANKHNND